MLNREQADAVIAAAKAMQEEPNEQNHVDFINTVTPSVAIELAQRHKQLARLLLLISSDSLAITHQTLGQYRTALLKAAQEAV